MEVAVLIATYNGASYIRDLLDSLTKQDFQNFTCYIHDDGSKDETIDIVKEYQKDTMLDIHLLNYPPTGSATANFLSMLRYVHEPYAMFCDQDDIWLENKISSSLRTIKAYEDGSTPILVFSDLTVVDNNLNVISKSFMEYTGLDPERTTVEGLLLDNVVAGCTTIMNRILYEKTYSLDSYDRVNIHDHFMALLAACSGIIAYINEPLILYRQHGRNEKGAVKHLTAIERVIGNLRNITRGTYKKNFKTWMSRLQSQAGLISEMDGLNDSSRRLCGEFSDLSNKNKIYRVQFYLQNRVLRKEHNIWFLLWG